MNIKKLLIYILSPLIVVLLAFIYFYEGDIERQTEFYGIESTPSTESEMEEVIREFPGQQTHVSVDGNTIYYVGGTTGEGYDQLVALKNDSVDTLEINSLGGEIFWGVKIGRFVKENNLNVTVDENCFSSCANYIFTAANNKTIKKDSLVGWHGSAHQEQYLALHEDRNEREIYIDMLVAALKEAKEDGKKIPQDMLWERLADEMGRYELRKEMEEEFFSYIGVNGEVAIYGFLPEHYDEIQYSGGWTFSIEDMEKFNIRNIVYEGDDQQGVYPNEKVMPKLGLVKLSY